MEDNVWASLKEEMRKTLDKLDKSDFNRFKHYLKDERKIAWRKLQKAGINKTVDLMVQAYTQACKRMVIILQKMNQSLSATELETKLQIIMGGRQFSHGRSEANAQATGQSEGVSTSQQAGTSPPSNLKIVLLGKSGSGRSSTANTILGKRVFKAEKSFDPVTQCCKKRCRKVEGRTITVVDTPGLSCPPNDTLWTDILEYLEPGPNVFLLVISVCGRPAKEVQNVVKEIEENLGRDVLCYIIILFTHVDELEGVQLEDCCRNNAFFRRLINSCGGRFHSFNNNSQDNYQVKKLLKKIDKLVWWNSSQAMYERENYQE